MPIKRIKHIAVLAIGLVLFTASSFEVRADSTNTFVISSIYVSLASNFNYRVYGFSSPTCPDNFAYMDESDSGQPEKLVALQSAFLTGKSVALLVTGVNHNGDGTLYCNIQEIQVFN